MKKFAQTYFQVSVNLAINADYHTCALSWNAASDFMFSPNLMGESEKL